MAIGNLRFYFSVLFYLANEFHKTRVFHFINIFSVSLVLKDLETKNSEINRQSAVEDGV